MRYIAKIAEVVYPRLEIRPCVPLTPRRRTRSISLPYKEFPSPVPLAQSEDADNTGEIEGDSKVTVTESTGDSQHQSTLAKVQ